MENVYFVFWLKQLATLFPLTRRKILNNDYRKHDMEYKPHNEPMQRKLLQ